jgi:hypothetical protein
MKITKYQVEQWMGSDNLGVDDFLDLLTELINGTYPIEMFKEDVLDYAKQGEE